MNHQVVCRTVLATPVLSNTKVKQLIYLPGSAGKVITYDFGYLMNIWEIKTFICVGYLGFVIWDLTE